MRPYDIMPDPEENIAPDLTPEEQRALVEALEPFAKEARRMEPDGPCKSIGDSVEVWQVGSEEYRRSRITYGDLRRAHAALHASQKPKDCAPDDIPVGDEFCFHDDERDEIPAIMMEDAGRMGRPRCWRRKGMHSVFQFSPGARLIPLPEQDG